MLPYTIPYCKDSGADDNSQGLLVHSMQQNQAFARMRKGELLGVGYSKSLWSPEQIPPSLPQALQPLSTPLERGSPFLPRAGISVILRHSDPQQGRRRVRTVQGNCPFPSVSHHYHVALRGWGEGEKVENPSVGCGGLLRIQSWAPSQTCRISGKAEKSKFLNQSWMGFF